MRRIYHLTMDLIMVYGSILLSFLLLKGMLQDYDKNFNAFLIISPFIGALFILFKNVYGLFRSSRQKLTEVIYTVALVSISLMVGTMAICFFIRNDSFAYPRSVILLSCAITFFTLGSWRTYVWRKAKRTHGIKSVAVVGNDANQLVQSLKDKHSDIYNVKHVCHDSDPELMIKISSVEKIFITSGINEQIREKVFHFATDQNITVYFVPKYSDIDIMNSMFEKVDDIPTYRVSKSKLTEEDNWVKRAFDIVLSSTALVIASPFFILVALLTKLDGGPVFYTQERLTIGGRIFKVYKFRSMVPNAESLSGPILAGEDDPRITRIGKFVRATRLDELPQLINIIKGDMSIVGPRPERPFFVNQFEQDLPEYHNRLKVKAGLTGLAQIMGKYNTIPEEKLRYDLIYINNYSVIKDIFIMLQTVKILFMKSSTEGVASTSKEAQKAENGNLGNKVLAN